nr:cytochrome c biogenesis protein CcdA [Planctomycetota bacterium]
GNGAGGKPVNPRPDVVADTPQVPPALSEEEGGAQVRLSKDGKEIIVTFAPTFGWYFYGPDDQTGSIQVSVEPVPTEGVEFGEVTLPPGEKITSLMPYEVKVPFTRADSAKAIELKVVWQGCSEEGTCNNPRRESFRITWPGGADEPAPAKEPDQPVEQGEVLFPVVEDDEIGSESDSSVIQRLMRDSPLLGFGFIFIIGLGLAFTPCVLPIVPITVSVITGGNADIPKKRLTGLLGTYVGGLALTFGAMGVIAALAGGGLATAFTLPAVQWGIAILFIALSFSMIGVYELQPPAWLMNLQGGAQKRQGSVLGAFLFGCLGAVIASPCVAPVVAGMLIVTANTGSIPLGFFMFFTLGIGMGTVFFSAGALNFLMRPGPWMIWVRYVFGMLLFGVALYYLKSGGHISEAALWGMGVGVSVLAMLGVAWHLRTKEGESAGPARMRGIKVATLFMASVVAVFFITKKPEGLLDWIYVEDSEHLVALVEQAKSEGKPAVVDFWAEWCYYCKEYDKLIAAEPEVRERFEQVMRIKVDLTDDDQRWDVRHAVGQEAPLQPFLVFIDRQGRIRRKADVDKFLDPEEIVKRLDLILNSEPVETSSR